MLPFNSIYKIDQLAFKGLHVLRKLAFSHNLLTSAPSIVDVKDTLQLLDLSWNDISNIRKLYFDSCYNMRRIYIHHNQLNIIPNLQGVSTTLQNLEVGANNISDAKSLYNIPLPKLRHVSLDSNQITKFCFPPITRHLQMVSLSSNRLSLLRFSQLNASNHQKVSVALSCNPWHCNGSLEWTQRCIP